MFNIYFAPPVGWVDQLLKWAVPSIALVGAVYTGFQYRRAQRWRAGDLAAALVAALEIDEELAFACYALDWGTGTLIVPQKYRPLLERIKEDQKNPTPYERGKIIRHDITLLFRAVEPFLSIDPEAEPGGLIYRYCFDKLFNHLENVNRLLAAGQLKKKDLSGFKYWLKRIANYDYIYSDGPLSNEIFQPFLYYKEFGYRGVITLGEKLGVPGWNGEKWWCTWWPIYEERKRREQEELRRRRQAVDLD